MAKKTQLVKKKDKATLSNVLNEMITNRMTLQELRFFLVYLSKINSKNPDQTEVSFTLKEYSEALGVELNESTMGKVTDDLMCKIVHIRPKVVSDEFYEVIIKTHLFRRCVMSRRKSDNKWIFTFDASEDVKPHLFDLKSEYTSFEIWNTLNLGNVQDARMYMLLRQYRVAGERTIELRELKRMLGIDIDSYPEYKVFARDVLKKCQKALKKRTDICFEFNAVGRPAKSVHFDIFKNEDYTLPKFLAAETSTEVEGQMSFSELPAQVEDDFNNEQSSDFVNENDESAFSKVNTGYAPGYLKWLEIWRDTMEPLKLTIPEIDYIASAAVKVIKRAYPDIFDHEELYDLTNSYLANARKYALANPSKTTVKAHLYWLFTHEETQEQFLFSL